MSLSPCFKKYSIKRAIENKIPVVLVSRCTTGRVLGSYGYKCGGRELFSLGVINGGALPGHKVRIALMALIAAGKTNSDIADFFKI